MSRTLNGNLTGKAAHGAGDINESIPAANIIDEMIEAIQFYAEQKRIQMTCAVSKKGTACLFCKTAFRLHKKQASVKDAFMVYASIGDSDNPVDEAEIETREIPEPAQLPASPFAMSAAIEYDEAYQESKDLYTMGMGG
jgi:hypothetical protein